MELQTIQTTTTWNDAAQIINSNTSKINIEIEKLRNATYKSKGYFKTLADLQSAYPTASAGSIAYVGGSYPYYIYLWESNGWVNTNETVGEGSVNLDGYYTKEETQQVIDDYHEVLTQEAYDSLPTKEDKFYFTYEEE